MGLQGGTTRANIEGENLVLGGDIILEVQGIPLDIGNYQEIRDMVSRLDPGDIVRVKVLRGGEQLELKSLKLP
jgi:serine protease Do